jgi:hypothetical protein
LSGDVNAASVCAPDLLGNRLGQDAQLSLALLDFPVGVHQLGGPLLHLRLKSSRARRIAFSALLRAELTAVIAMELRMNAVKKLCESFAIEME